MGPAFRYRRGSLVAVAGGIVTIERLSVGDGVLAIESQKDAGCAQMDERTTPDAAMAEPKLRNTESDRAGHACQAALQRLACRGGLNKTDEGDRMGGFRDVRAVAWPG